MKILLIEDDEHKWERLKNFLESTLEFPELILAKSVQEGLTSLRHFVPDLMVLDMSLPVFTYSAKEQGFQHSSYAGKDILEHLFHFDINVPVIIFTAFDRFGDDNNAVTLSELDLEFKRDYPEQYVGCVWYNSLEDGWQDELLKLINQKFKI
ncbi:response regulator [Hymenobacter sp. BT730]|uniref:response regulator n=1 Tax=Hymenobacter sp. BT730 TaxID=3063332 RepID=UPI0026DF2628|nr:response regulator [Hymenobacter sp. BT730]